MFTLIALLSVCFSFAASLFTCILPESSLQVDLTTGQYHYIHTNAHLSLLSGRVAVLANSTFLDSVTGTLVVSNSQTGSTTDARLGPYTWLNLTWAPLLKNPFLTSLVTQFRCFPTFLAFVTELPSGAANTSSTAIPNSSRGEFSANAFPSVHFPSFPLHDALHTAGFVEWSGRFTRDTTSIGIGLQGFTGGQTGGPLVLFDPTFVPNSASAARPSALVLAPLSSLKASILGLTAGPPMNSSAPPLQWLSGGPQGKPNTLPPGFSYSFALVPSEEGVGAATYAFGAVLRAAQGTTRMASSPASLSSALEDVGTSYLSYWSDNGAYYDNACKYAEYPVHPRSHVKRAITPTPFLYLPRTPSQIGAPLQMQATLQLLCFYASLPTTRQTTSPLNPINCTCGDF